jgi:hypothetical protein
MGRVGADNFAKEKEHPEAPDNSLANRVWQDQPIAAANTDSQKHLALEPGGKINFSQQDNIYQPKQTTQKIENGTKSWPEEGISAQFEKITAADKTRTEKYTLNMSDEAHAAGQFEHMVKQYDKKGKLVSKETSDHSGNHIVLGDIQNGSPQSITIDKGDGTHVELHKGTSHYKMAGTWSDKSGATGPVVWQGDHLVYKDNAGNITGSDRFDPNRPGHIAFELSADKLDLDTGKAARFEADGTRTEMSFSPGRRDLVATDGSISGTVERVDKAGKKTTVEVSHQDSAGNVSIVNVKDNSVITLEQNKISYQADVKAEHSNEKNAEKSFSEALSEGEQAYIASHPEVSRRDIAQLHVRLHDKPEELAKVYQSLNKLDDVKNLSAAESAALKESALHNVAYPAEISQGQSGTCYAAAPERVLATAQPSHYINIINEAISTNRVTTNGENGPEIKELNPTVLHQKDSSGRDIASRIFQTTFSEVGFALKPPEQSPIAETYSTVDYSSGIYRNTKDGLGVLLKPDGKSETYPGMDLMQVTDTLNRLSAPDHPGYKLNVAHDSDSLYSAFKANGEQPMISAVDRGAGPFGGKTHNPGDSTNHVITIGAMEPEETANGARYRTTFQMNGGAADDITTDDTKHMINVTSNSKKGIKPTVVYISERS